MTGAASKRVNDTGSAQCGARWFFQGIALD